MIYIDFQAGSHGNFLEFVCNRFLAGIDTQQPHPFNSLNAAHHKTYLADPVFRASHYTEFNHVLRRQKVVTITIDVDDLLPLQCISLLRAGDYDIRPDQLEHDTYHKLNNRDYRWVLDNLIHSFFDSQHLVKGYTEIADASWPRIQNVGDYEALPEEIREECETVHGIEINQLDAEHPHCPRWILKEFFQIGFRDPLRHGFMLRQAQQIHEQCELHPFAYSAFYDSERFMSELEAVADFCSMPWHQHRQQVHDLHQQFLERQPYRGVKQRCDDLVRQLRADPDQILPQLDVIQEAYIAARLAEQHDPA